MSFNRRRNIFTLGDFQTQQHPHHQFKQQNPIRSQNSDIFARDPFKIQSYNFRYAERPSFPLENLTKRVAGPQSPKKPFETFFYNYDFAASRHDKENPATNRFHEHRRRKFVQGQQHTQAAQPSSDGHNSSSSGSSGATRGVLQNINATNSKTSHRGPRSSTAAQATPTTSPLLRSGCNREYLQGLRAIYSPRSHIAANTNTTAAAAAAACNKKQQEKNHQILQPNNSDSRSSFSSHRSSGNRYSGGRRLYKENGIESAERFTTSSTSALHNTRRPLSLARESSSYTTTPPRKPLQALQHVPSENVMTQNAAHRISSGCNININIKGLNGDNQLGENVTIKIEADNNGAAAAGESSYEPSCSNMLNQERISSPCDRDNFNIKQQSSSSSNIFVIDKHISKYSVIRTSSAQINVAAQEQKPLNRELPPNLNKRYAAKLEPVTQRERLPSIMPWVAVGGSSHTNSYKNKLFIEPCWKDNQNQNNDNDNNNNIKTRRLQAIYQSGANDLKNLKRHNYENHSNHNYHAAAATTPSARDPMQERKLLNTTTIHSLHRSSASSLNAGKQHCSSSSQSSRHSLRSQLVAPRTSQLHPLMTHTKLSACRSDDSHFKSRSHSPLVYQSRSNLSKSPLNVNINVYADKLKLLRV